LDPDPDTGTDPLTRLNSNLIRIPDPKHWPQRLQIRLHNTDRRECSKFGVIYGKVKFFPTKDSSSFILFSEQRPEIVAPLLGPLRKLCAIQLSHGAVHHHSHLAKKDGNEVVGVSSSSEDPSKTVPEIPAS